MSNFTRLRIANGPNRDFVEVPEGGTLYISLGDRGKLEVSEAKREQALCTISQTPKANYLDVINQGQVLLNGEYVERATLIDRDVLSVGELLLVHIAPDRWRTLKRHEVTRKCRKSDAHPFLGHVFANFQAMTPLWSTHNTDVFLGLAPANHDRFGNYPIQVHLLKEGIDDEMARRFRHQVQTLRPLQHDNVLRYKKHGEHEGREFLVVLHPDGQNLGELIADGHQLEETEALRIGCDMAAAIDYLSRKKLVVRNLRPEHFVVGFDGPTVLCNLERCVDSGAELSTASLTNGAPTTMLRHLPPEYFDEQHVADSRSDMFSLASILYRMIGGRTPWEPNDEDPASLENFTLTREAFEQAPVSIQDRNPYISAKLWKVLRKALSVDKKDRYKDMNEFREALEALRDESTASKKSEAVSPK